MSPGLAPRREPVDRAEMSAAALLRLLWLASPALPVGGFSYSEGLEAAVEAGLVGDEAQTAAWLTDQLELAQARADLPLLARAHAAWQAHDVAALARLNDWVRQTRETAELRQQSEQMGRSLTEWLRNDATTDRQRLATLAALAPAPTWPLAFALAGLDCAADGLLLAHAFGWAENMVQAALKAVPLGQSAGQRVLATLARAAPDAVARALHAADDERQAFAPLLAILSSQHETQYSRLFRS